MLLHGLIPQERAPSTLVPSALWATSRETANFNFDGRFAFDGVAEDAVVAQAQLYLPRWQPPASRSRGVGAWLLTDMADEDRAWGFLEIDTLTPLDAAAACWTFYCRGRASQVGCPPHVSVVNGETPAPCPVLSCATALRPFFPPAPGRSAVSTDPARACVLSCARSASAAALDSGEANNARRGSPRAAASRTCTLPSKAPHRGGDTSRDSSGARWLPAQRVCWSTSQARRQ